VTRRLPLSRVSRVRLSPAELRELADNAGRMGRTAQPMADNRRVDGYHRQNTGARLRLFEEPRLTPSQLRRAWKKARRRMHEADLHAVLHGGRR